MTRAELVKEIDRLTLCVQEAAGDAACEVGSGAFRAIRAGK